MYGIDGSPELDGLVEALRGIVAGADPGTWSGETALEALDRFDQLARLASAGRALAAGRVADTGSWRTSGHRTAPAFLAARLGVTRAEAAGMVAVAAAVPSLPHLDDAVRAGELSAAAAADIAACATDHPDAERELLAVAATGTLRHLRERCAAVRLRGADGEEHHRRARANRSCTEHIGADGTWTLRAQGAPGDAAVISHTLHELQQVEFDLARGRGERLPFAAYRFDALARMARLARGLPVDVPGPDGTIVRSDTLPAPAVGGRPTKLRHSIAVRVDLTALRRGLARPGETCEIPGVGPVPVSVVDDILTDGDPIVTAVVTHGRDVTALATLDRKTKDDLRLAVRERDRWCQVPGCRTEWPLELDHAHTVDDRGPDSYDNLRALCRPHHQLRTTGGYELTGPVGARRWLDPDGNVIADDPPPDPDDPAAEPTLVTFTRRRLAELPRPGPPGAAA